MNVFEAQPAFDRELVFALMRLADDSESQIREYIHRGRLFLLQGEQDPFPIGQSLVLDSSASEAEIKSVSISPDRQRQGLGSLLLKEVLAALKRNGTTRVTVATSTADLTNIAFYQKLGFRCLKIDRDAFTPRHGYPENLEDNGILVRDKIWFDLYL